MSGEGTRGQFTGTTTHPFNPDPRADRSEPGNDPTISVTNVVGSHQYWQAASKMLVEMAFSQRSLPGGRWSRIVLGMGSRANMPQCHLRFVNQMNWSPIRAF